MENDRLERAKGSIFLFLAFAMAGTSVIAARLVSGQLGPFTIAAVSLLFAVICLVLPCAPRLPGAVRGMNRRGWLMLALQAVFGIFLFRLFLLQGLARTSAGEAGLLTGATPAFTALLAHAALKERMGKRGQFGILSTIAGILLVQGGLTGGNGFSPEHFRGNILVLCAAASEATFNTLSRLSHLDASRRAEKSLDPMVQTLLVSTMALVLCGAFALSERPLASLAVIDARQWLALAWYGAVVTALAFVCWYAGIRRRGAYQAAAFSGMMPFTSLLLSVIVLGEQANWPQWTGGIFIVFGMLLIGKGDAAPSAVRGAAKPHMGD